MKKILVIAMIFLAAFIYVSDKKVVADSGFDSGSSDSWSSSDSSSDSNSDSSDTEGSVDIFVFLVFIVFMMVIGMMLSSDLLFKSRAYFYLICLLIVVFSLIMFNIIAIPFLIFMYAGFKKARYKTAFITKKEVSDEKLKEIGILDKEQFKWELYNKYVEIQKGWMNIDYNLLRPLLSDELYNQYKSQLEVLELKGNRNIMDRFEYVDSRIIEVSKKEDKISLKLLLNVKMYDYILDKNGTVIKGNKDKRIDITYIINFEKSMNKELTRCPNCGAEITTNNRNECPNCNSVIVHDSRDYVMSKKENIGQSWE